jgi:hypothetical protein
MRSWSFYSIVANWLKVWGLALVGERKVNTKLYNSDIREYEYMNSNGDMKNMISETTMLAFRASALTMEIPHERVLLFLIDAFWSLCSELLNYLPILPCSSHTVTR